MSLPAAGIFSGNIAVIHSVLGELTDSTNQAIAFPIYGLFWPLGAIIGYAININASFVCRVAAAF